MSCGNGLICEFQQESDLVSVCFGKTTQGSKAGTKPGAEPPRLGDQCPAGLAVQVQRGTIHRAWPPTVERFWEDT